MEEEPHRYEDSAEDTDPDYTTPSGVRDRSRAKEEPDEDQFHRDDAHRDRISLLCDGSSDDRVSHVI